MIMKNKIWVTQKKEEIPIVRLKDDHLENCIGMIESMGGKGKHWRNGIYYDLLEERKRRKEIRKTEMGKILYGND